MSKSLASFCRLCLTKTSSKVAVFGTEQENVLNLLTLIELSINPDSEFDAAVCFDCIVTLEAFLQFKDKCHVNDEFLKTLPPKNSAEDSEASQEDEDEDAMECDYLEEDDDDDDGTETRDCVEHLVDEVEPQGTYNIKDSQSNKEQIHTIESVMDSKQNKEIDPLYIIKRVRKQKLKPRSSKKKVMSEPKKPIPQIPEFPGPQPTEDELPKLQDSYPDYFHFERGQRSQYFDLIYHGERFNSAIYGRYHTYWQCAHKKTLNCPALLYVSNDYTEFERRYEHTHGRKKTKGETELFTPEQALPTVFQICWHRVKVKRDKDMAISLEKKEKKAKTKPKTQTVSRPKEKMVVRKKPIPKIPEFPGPQPNEDELPKLQNSYPDYFYFERGHNTRYYDLVYYGERFNSASFGARNTYWQCAHRKKFKCPALLHVSNDYTQFERRYEHTHADPKPRRNPELYTPKQALPTMFRIWWHKMQKQNTKRLQTKELMNESKCKDDIGLGE